MACALQLLTDNNKQTSKGARKSSLYANMYPMIYGWNCRLQLTTPSKERLSQRTRNRDNKLVRYLVAEAHTCPLKYCVPTRLTVCVSWDNAGYLFATLAVVSMSYVSCCFSSGSRFPETLVVQAWSRRKCTNLTDMDFDIILCKYIVSDACFHV